MSRIDILADWAGIRHMRVCAPTDASDEDILAACNQKNPSGTKAGWSVVRRADDAESGKVGPVQCANDPTRTHFMVAC